MLCKSLKDLDFYDQMNIKVHLKASFVFQLDPNYQRWFQVYHVKSVSHFLAVSSHLGTTLIELKGCVAIVTTMPHFAVVSYLKCLEN